MATTRQTLKQYFRQYATPTEAQFAALIDSFVHKDEDSLTQSKIDGLVAALDGKVSTNQVNTMVESKVSEIVSDPQFAAAPTAHSHVAADVEGLSAFITRVTNFLDSADVSDTTINRWKEIETFLTGITDQETLAGLLLQLKNEITALIPAPAPTNYLKQIADLDAYTTAQEGEIVQYVGSTTAKYTRGYCYEQVILNKEETIFNEIEHNDNNTYELTEVMNHCDFNGIRKIIYTPSSQFLRNYSDWAELKIDFEALTIPANDNPIGKDLYLWQYQNEVYSPKCYSVEYSGGNPVQIGSGYTYPKYSEEPYARIVEYDFEIKNGVAYVNGEPCNNNPQKNVRTSGGVYKAESYALVIGDNNQVFLEMLVAPSNDSMDSQSSYLLRTSFLIPVLAYDDPSAPNMEADITKTCLCFDGPRWETKTISDFIVCQISKETIQVPTWQPIVTSPSVS